MRQLVISWADCTVIMATITLVTHFITLLVVFRILRCTCPTQITAEGRGLTLAPSLPMFRGVVSLRDGIVALQLMLEVGNGVLHVVIKGIHF